MRFELVSLSVLFLCVCFIRATESAKSIARDELSNKSGEASASSVVGEQGSSNSYFPWTYKPVCSKYLDGVGDKLCVYTNATFSNGRGISIFTTPRIAEEFAALPPFREPAALLAQGINSGGITKDQPWYTSVIPDKGTGMFASRPLDRSDRITAFTPYLLAHMENILTTQERENFLRIAVDQLPKASRAAYLDLAKIYNEPSVVVQDVVKANAFEIQIGGLMHLAVFPESSRFNHACAPK